MSRIIATAAIKGAHSLVAQAEKKWAEAVEEKGEDAGVEFPNTAYFLPVIHSILGEEVRTLGDMKPILDRAKALLPPVPAERVWLPYLGETLDAGMAALFAEEIIEACKYVVGLDPVNDIWLGAADDIILRERGIEFVSGTAPGFAACVGALPTNEEAVKLARELQERSLYVFMAGHTNGRSMAEQLAEEGIELGWETRLVPFGKEITAAIYAAGFAARAAMTYGGVKPGDYQRVLRYNKDRIFAFVLALGEVDEEKYATAAGVINFGFPTIADTDIPQILPTGICTYEHVVSNVTHEEMVDRAVEVRGLKVKVSEVPIPVPFSPAFEGERVRREEMYLEIGGRSSMALEFLTTRDMDEVEDGKIELVGPDLDSVEEGGALPLAIIVEVAGRRMQSDFEPILERQIHAFLNEAHGVFHMGQRDIAWIRVSKDAKEAGFTLEHVGKIVHAKLHDDYSAILDKVQVTLFTEEEQVQRFVEIARRVFIERDARLKGMTDDDVEVFYSCALCQSFAPNHVCVISPERSGLCGAYSWLDGRAAYEISPAGANQPVSKGRLLDETLGQWENVNKFVYEHTNKMLERVSMYSMIIDPMTSCGCFE
ncbi:MAG: CO dehydrogenase/CO-methylating acetyl-CoA synthase complex subunit beta, partial [Planctomycetes bacterium]|nr:CO dehydrogenase/CO-methylating acetyl-CoA synthase complex subunit beta [Planctomycetota bacterium]